MILTWSRYLLYAGPAGDLKGQKHLELLGDGWICELAGLFTTPLHIRAIYSTWSFSRRSRRWRAGASLFFFVFFFSLIVDRTSFKTAGPSATAAEHDKRILPERCIHLRRDADSAAIMQGEPPEKIFAGQRSTIHGPHGSCCVGYSADTRTPRTGPVTLFSDRLGEDRKGGSSSKIQIQIQDPGKPKTRTKALQVDSARNHLHPSASTGLRMVPRVEIHACLSLEVQVLRRGPWPGPGKHRRQQRSHLQREKGRAVEQKKTLRKSCGRKSTVQERREKKKTSRNYGAENLERGKKLTGLRGDRDNSHLTHDEVASYLRFARTRSILLVEIHSR